MQLDFAEFVIKFVIIFCPPNQGAHKATKAAVSLSMQFIYLIFSWTLKYGNFVKISMHFKAIVGYKKVNSKLGGAQTGRSWFFASFTFY